MAQRICEVPGCGKTYRARGYCSTHYNLRVMGERRHPHRPVPCTVCGVTVQRRVDNNRRPTCSVECRSALCWGQALAPRSSYEWAVDAVKRARAAGVQVVEVFDREVVFARDGWRCRGCGVACTEPNPFVLASATVDHVLALADGGEHSLANAQTLCLSCNSTKRPLISSAA